MLTAINKLAKCTSHIHLIGQYISLYDMFKPKRVVVLVVLPFAAFVWLVGWCINWAGTKKVNLKIKSSQYTKLFKIK
jgi:hypothetical protein